MSTTSRIHSQRDFREWESRFDAELKKPAAKIAWRTLLEHHCDPNALQSALYYAARHLRIAHEAHHGNEFDTTREEILGQVAQLEKTVRQMMTLRIQDKAVATDVMFLWGVKKKEVRFFQSFPALLVRFENILNVLRVPRARRDTLEDWLITSGESLLRLYVKEVTTKTFSEENAVLLEASAASAGLSYWREYSTEAVSRRYRRFRKGNDSHYKEMQLLVRNLKANKDTFVDDFLDLWKVRLYGDWSLQQLVLSDADPSWVLRNLVAMYRKDRR